MQKIGILKLQRTDEEKLRRHLYGDRGAKFKKGKQPWIDWGGPCPSITTMVLKDVSLVECNDD